MRCRWPWAASITGVLAIALAIVSWQANKAVKEAGRAQAMQDFVIALFENTGDGRHDQGLDVRALLDAGVVRADTELAMQPRARAELLGLIARLRAGLGDDRETLRLLDKQQQVMRSLGDAAPGNLALEAAALRGRSLRELDRSPDCLATLGPLLADAQGQADTWPLQTAEFLSQLGRCHRQQQGTDVARDLFGQALQLRRASKGANALEAESLTDLALLQLDEGRVADGVSALRDALQKLRANGGERNAAGLDIWRSLGDAYRQLDNTIESQAAYRQALDIALDRFGAQHPRTAVVQQRLADSLVRTGQFEEAERLLRLAQDTYTARDGGDSPALAPIASLRGLIAIERDLPAEAEAALVEATRLWRLQAQIARHGGDLCLLAISRASQGRADAAGESAEECLTLLQTQAAERARAAAALADDAADRGDLVQARGWLERVAGAQAPGGRVSLARARLAVDTAAVDADARLAEAVAAVVENPGGRRAAPGAGGAAGRNRVPPR